MSNCANTPKNLGFRELQNNLRHLKRLILVNTYDSSGVLTELANNAAVTKSALQAKFNAANTQDRFYPTPIIKNVAITSDDPKVSTDDDDQAYFIRHGKIAFEGYIWNPTEDVIRKLASWNYKGEIAFYGIDNAKNFKCLRDTETLLKVRPIPLRSFYVNAVEPTADDVYKAKVTFEIDVDDLRYYMDHINYCDLDFDGLSANDVYSLEDVSLSVTNPTGTGFTVTAVFTEDPTEKVDVLKVANLLLTKAGNPVSISALTLQEDGTYIAEAVMTANEHVLTGSKSRYSFDSDTFTPVIS